MSWNRSRRDLAEENRKSSPGKTISLFILSKSSCQSKWPLAHRRQIRHRPSPHLRSLFTEYSTWIHTSALNLISPVSNALAQSPGPTKKKTRSESLSAAQQITPYVPPPPTSFYYAMGSFCFTGMQRLQRVLKHNRGISRCTNYSLHPVWPQSIGYQPGGAIARSAGNDNCEKPSSSGVFFFDPDIQHTNSTSTSSAGHAG